MRVFLSWSGETSRLVAETLRDWLPNVIQALDPWMSSEDVDKGARWAAEIAEGLNSIKAGIICLTSENLKAAWINFEAGALSRTIEKTLVCPYLIGIDPSDLGGPLVQFQATMANKKDTRRLIETLNTALEGKALNDKQLEKAFETWWPELEDRLQSILENKVPPRQRRSERELLEEILALVRDLVRRDSPLESPKVTRARMLEILGAKPMELDDWVSYRSDNEKRLFQALADLQRAKAHFSDESDSE